MPILTITVSDDVYAFLNERAAASGRGWPAEAVTILEAALPPDPRELARLESAAEE